MAREKIAIGLIVAKVGLFPAHLAKSERENMVRARGEAGIDATALTPEQSKYGARIGTYWREQPSGVC